MEQGRYMYMCVRTIFQIYYKVKNVIFKVMFHLYRKEITLTHMLSYAWNVFIIYKCMGMLVCLGKGTRSPGLGKERNLDYTVFLLGHI